MGFISWIILGGIAGWLASVIMKTDQGTMWDIIMGIVGSVIGGMIMNALGQPGVTGLNLYSIVVAAIGASVVIYVGRVLRRTP